MTACAEATWLEVDYPGPDGNRKGVSNYSGRVGKPVASELCTVVDDADVTFGRGAVNVDDEGVRVTEAGRFFLRPIAMVFDRHLQQQRTTAIGVIAAQDKVREAAQYSRLI